MPTFTAAVEFHFEAESLEQAGSHLRELATAARAVSFRMTRGEVKPTPPTEDDEGDLSGWTQYTP